MFRGMHVGVLNGLMPAAMKSIGEASNRNVSQPNQAWFTVSTSEADICSQETTQSWYDQLPNISTYMILPISLLVVTYLFLLIILMLSCGFTRSCYPTGYLNMKRIITRQEGQPWGGATWRGLSSQLGVLYLCLLLPLEH